MTSYAMPGHLAFNMIWLAFLLHDRWYSHLGALTVGFAAVGLHQLAYHPLFAGPLLLCLLVARRRWLLAVIYAGAYAAAIWFWTRWGGFAMAELGVSYPPGGAGNFIWRRIMWAISEISPAYLWTQCANLVRFVAWQNVLLLPLLLAGLVPAIRSRNPLLLGMVLAIAVLVIVKTILRPYQGLGWGFRYMHGVIGVAAIVAGVGWRALRARGAIGPNHLLAGTAASLLVFAPFLLLQAHALTSAPAQVDRAISATDADLAIVDNTAPDFTADLVHNPPHLDRRPIRLLASELDPAQVAALCADASVAFVDARDLAPIAAEFGKPFDPAGGVVPELRRAALAAGCEVNPLAPIG